MRTRVGYAGGGTPDPTYHRLGDHTETLQVDFDPSRISYAELLDVFFTEHEPTTPPYSRQYMSAIFTHDEEQLRLAESARDRFEAVLHRPVLTRIEPFRTFWPAEEYHQKYRLRHAGELYREFRTMYPEPADLVASTAAARVNGFLDGSGDPARLEAEIDRYGLSDRGKKVLRDLVSSRSRGIRILG